MRADIQGLRFEVWPNFWVLFGDFGAPTLNFWVFFGALGGPEIKLLGGFLGLRDTLVVQYVQANFALLSAMRTLIRGR